MSVDRGGLPALPGKPDWYVEADGTFAGSGASAMASRAPELIDPDWAKLDADAHLEPTRPVQDEQIFVTVMKDPSRNRRRSRRGLGALLRH